MDVAYLHPIFLCLRGNLALLLIGSSALFLPVYAQSSPDSLLLQDGWSSFIESQLQVGLLSEEEAQSAAMLYDELRRTPLNINVVSAEELRRIPLLTDYQIYQFIHYRTEHRSFHELSELKLVPGWGLSLIAQLLPVLTCHTQEEDQHMLGNTLQSTYDASLFYGRHSSTTLFRKALLGSSDAIRCSYSYSTPKHLSLFVAGEKDYGEPWHWEGHRGFDAYSFHAQLQFRTLTLLVGDYRVARGSGLLLAQGAFPLNYLSLTPRQGMGIRPVRNMTETDFSRGVACVAQIGVCRVGAFASLRRLDAHRISDGMLSALSEAGLHTTDAAWSARGKAKSRLCGGWLEYHSELLDLAIQGIYQDWQGDQLRHPPGSQGDHKLEGLSKYAAGSLSYRYQTESGHLRMNGEMAWMNQSAWAFIQHLSYLQGAWADIHLSLWHIGKHYWTYYGRAGTHSLRPHGEDGGRFQLQLTPLGRLGTTLLYCEGYRVHLPREGTDAYRTGINYGLMTSLQLETDMSVVLHYRGRKGSQRIKLEGQYNLGVCRPRLALLYASGEKGSSWAVQSAVSCQPSDRLQVDCFADVFQAPNWESRLYALTPMIRGEYGTTLLYGRGLLVGGRVRFRLNPHWQAEGRIQYERQQQEERPTKTLIAVALRCQGW